MTRFMTYATQIRQLLIKIVSSKELHAGWLNTLSFLENCGARKIAACEHPTLVREEMLKHAAEEFRHAHYLKRQIARISAVNMENYSLSLILGGVTSLNYLEALDLKTSRYLRIKGLSTRSVKEAAYLLVTYAIELRADELYHIYDEVLREAGSRVAVKSILLEEKEHLSEMIEGLKQFPSGLEYAEQVCEYEGFLCERWLKALWNEIFRA